MRAALDSGDQRSGARRTAYVARGSDQASLPGVETPARFKGHDRRPPRLRRKTQTELEERIVPTRALFLNSCPQPLSLTDLGEGCTSNASARRARHFSLRKGLAARELRDLLGGGLRTLRAKYPAFPTASPAAAACR